MNFDSILSNNIQDDLHFDDITGFRSKSNTLFFGRKCEGYVENPYMMIVASSVPDSILYIPVSDFLLLDWSITFVLGERFDEYENYSFPSQEWYRILEKGAKLLELEKFEQLRAEILAWDILDHEGKNQMLWQLELRGDLFLKESSKYRLQFDEIYKWSNLVLKERNAINIYGF